MTFANKGTPSSTRFDAIYKGTPVEVLRTSNKKTKDFPLKYWLFNRHPGNPYNDLIMVYQNNPQITNPYDIPLYLGWLIETSIPFHSIEVNSALETCHDDLLTQLILTTLEIGWSMIQDLSLTVKCWNSYMVGKRSCLPQKTPTNFLNPSCIGYYLTLVIIRV